MHRIQCKKERKIFSRICSSATRITRGCRACSRRCSFEPMKRTSIASPIAARLTSSNPSMQTSSRNLRPTVLRDRDRGRSPEELRDCVRRRAGHGEAGSGIRSGLHDTLRPGGHDGSDAERVEGVPNGKRAGVFRAAALRRSARPGEKTAATCGRRGRSGERGHAAVPARTQELWEGSRAADRSIQPRTTATRSRLKFAICCVVARRRAF